MLVAVLATGAVYAIAILEQRKGPARIVDGDTLWLEDRKIRLFGIDAPELHQTCKHADGSKWPCGRRARKRLAALLRQGEVTCRTIEQDRYGRDVAICKVNGQDIAATLVREGLAVAYGWNSPYRAEERAASKARLGIWQGDFVLPEQWRRAHRRRN